MSQHVDQYAFDPTVTEPQVRETLSLAVLATESYFGRLRVLGEARFDHDDDGVVWIDATNEVGEHLSKVFGGFVRREFGDRVRSLRTGPVPMSG